MNKLIVVALVGLLLVSCVSAFYCIYEEDTQGVKEFKSNINLISLKYDLEKGLTPEAILIRNKYFNPCN